MKKFRVTAYEDIWYEKVVEAKDEDEAYEIFYQTVTDEDVIDGQNFEVSDIVEVKEDE